MTEKLVEIKALDVGLHKRPIKCLESDMPTKEFEARCEPIVLDILENHEYFVSIEKGPSFAGTPFDFFGFRDGTPYVIEFKGSGHQFNLPGETQRRRMKELLKAVAGLHIALLQVKVCDGVYRILYNEEVTRLFSGRKAPMEPIVDWVKQRLVSGDEASTPKETRDA